MASSENVGTETRRRLGGRTRDRSDRIFASAIEILTADGYAALTFQGVAAHAGVSRSTLYRRWPTTADFVLDLIGHVLAERIWPADTGTLTGDLTASLRQAAAFVSSPLGGAAIAASIELERTHEATNRRRAMWDERLAQFEVVFERAKKRGELPTHFDADAALSMTSGAMIYRVLFMARPIDEEWIARIVAMITPAKRG